MDTPAETTPAPPPKRKAGRPFGSKDSKPRKPRDPPPPKTGTAAIVPTLSSYDLEMRHPQLLAAVQALLSDGAHTIRAIAQECSLPQATIYAVLRKMYAAGRLTDHLRDAEQAQWAMIQRAAQSVVLDKLADPDEAREMRPRDAAIIAAIASDKLANARGIPTQRIEVSVSGPTVDDLKGLQHALEAEVLAIDGKPTK